MNQQDLASELESLRRRVTELQDLQSKYEAMAEAFDGLIYKYRSLVDASPDPILMYDLKGDVISANQKAAELVGLDSPEDFIREVKNIGELLDPEDRERAFANFAHTLKTGTSARNEYLARWRDGQSWPVEVNSSVVRGVDGNAEAFVSVVRDITDRKKAEEAVRASEATLRSLLQAAPIGIGQVSQDRTLGWTNDVLCDILGYSRDELEGQSTRILYETEEEYLRVWQVKHPEVLRSGTGSVETRFKRKDGSGVDILLSSSAIVPGDLSHGFVFTVTDITEQKRGSEALRQSEQWFRTAFQTSPDAVSVSRLSDGLYTEINDGFTELTGFRKEEVLGKTALDINVWNDPRDRDYLIAQLKKRGHVTNLEAQFRLEDGRIRTGLISARVINLAGEPHLLSVTRDIEDWKKAEQAVRENEEKYRTLFDDSRDAVYMTTREGVLIEANQAYRDLFGFTREETRNMDILNTYLDPEDRRRFQEEVERKGSVKDYEIKFRRKDGAEIDCLLTATVRRNKDGTIFGYHGTIRDVTYRKRAEQELAKSVSLLNATLEATADGILVVDTSGRKIVSFNKRFCLMWGIPQKLLESGDDEIVLASVLDQVKDRQEFVTRIRELYNVPDAEGFDIIEFKDGRVFERHSQPQRLGERIVGRVWSFRDVTDRVRAAESLMESEEWYRMLVEESFDGIFVQRGSKIIFANSRLYEMLGYSAGELEGLDHWLIYHPDDQKITRERAAARMRGEEVVSQYEVRLRRKDGSSFHGEINGQAVTVKGEPGVQVWVRDISKRRRAEEVQRRLATAIEQSAEAVVITDVLANIQYVNPAFEEISGYLRGEVLGKNPRILQSGQHDTEFYHQMWETLSRGQVWRGRLTNKRKDGTLYEETATISPIKDSQGRIVNYVAVKRDMTAEAILQRQLLHAQKMEAVGTLAGGIAHDFNNLLQAILGYTDLLLMHKKRTDPDRHKLEIVHQSARDGADLVSRILTFSKKAEFKARPTDLNQEVRRVEKLLRRTVPRMIKIDLALANDLWVIDSDPTQIEQVLLNLAVNAQHAMPDGGRLFIETSNVSIKAEYLRSHLDGKPGKYVLLTVSDTGVGMTPGVVDRIFDPFFTTKVNGEGTGLGLAMVHGIVSQHGGYIRCYSEPGLGTSFKIYFPISETDRLRDMALTREMPAFGTETILLVDDDDRIRDVAHEMIKMGGYKVIVASSGEEALERYAAHRSEISLVILDLIMPGMGGKKCLEELLRIDPDSKVVFASGYSSDGLTLDETGTGARGFIRKPYDAKDILAAIRKALDRGYL